MIKTWFAAVAVACSGPADSDPTQPTPTEGLACDGSGVAALEIGEGALTNFVPWGDGTVVPLSNDGARYGFEMALRTEGLDTRRSVTVLIRYAFPPETTTEDVAATLSLQCPNEGPGWAGVFVPLDDSLQDAASVSGLDGADVDLRALVTDATGEVGEVRRALQFAVP